MDLTQPIAKGPEKFGDFSFLSKFVALAFALLAILAAADALIELRIMGLLNGEHQLAEVQSIQARAELVSLARTVCFFITVTVFCWWVYLANKNVRALGALDLFAKPGMAVAYFFIPVICLWMPYQAMKQVWQASHRPDAWKQIAVSPILPAWWTLWVASGYVLRIINVAVNHADTANQIRIVCFWDAVRLVAYSTWCVVTVILVLQIRAAQANAVAKIIA